jgi:hypothetical protein
VTSSGIEPSSFKPEHSTSTNYTTVCQVLYLTSSFFFNFYFVLIRRRKMETFLLSLNCALIEKNISASAEISTPVVKFALFIEFSRKYNESLKLAISFLRQAQCCFSSDLQSREVDHATKQVRSCSNAFLLCSEHHGSNFGRILEFSRHISECFKFEWLNYAVLIRCISMSKISQTMTIFVTV